MIQNLKELKAILRVETDEELAQIFRCLTEGRVNLKVIEDHRLTGLQFSLKINKEELKSELVIFPLAFYLLEEALYSLLNKCIKRGLVKDHFKDENKLKELIDFIED